MKSKKAQITVFIIIGIILVFSTALFYYVRTRTVEQKFETIADPSIEQVPNTLLPVRNFIQTCLTQTSKDAVVELGQHSGYVKVDQFNIPLLNTNPTEKQGLTFYTTKVPYWHHLKSPNNGKFGYVFEQNIPSP